MLWVAIEGKSVLELRTGRKYVLYGAISNVNSHWMKGGIKVAAVTKNTEMKFVVEISSAME